MQRTQFGAMACSIARTLEVIGDRLDGLDVVRDDVGAGRLEPAGGHERGVGEDLPIGQPFDLEQLVAHRLDRRPAALGERDREVRDLLRTTELWFVLVANPEWNGDVYGTTAPSLSRMM